MNFRFGCHAILCILPSLVRITLKGRITPMTKPDFFPKMYLPAMNRYFRLLFAPYDSDDTRVCIRWCGKPAHHPMMDFLPCSGWGNALGNRWADASLSFPCWFFGYRTEIFQHILFHCILNENQHKMNHNMMLLLKNTKTENFFVGSSVTPPCVSPSVAHIPLHPPSDTTVLRA